MSFPRYEKYKDSGVEWLGDIPVHWTTPPLYARYEQVLGKMLDQNKMTGDYPMTYVRNIDVQWDFVNIDDLPLIDIHPSEQSRFTVNEGDLLICEGGEVGRTAIWKGDDGEVAFQKAIHRLRPLDKNENARFFFYTMRFATALQVFLANSNPNTIPHLTGEQLRGYRLPKPPPDEQHAIASFLDRETAKIDSLVAEQRRLVELLKEKRQAVISHAVTKGLDPTVPMKPSGIPWLGDVPEHWEVIALKHLASLKSGEGITSERIEATGDYPVFGGNGLRGFTNDFTHDGHYVIIGRQGALCGNVNYGSGKFWASEHAVVATPTRDLDTVWLGEMMRSMNLNQYSETAAQPGLSMLAVGNLRSVIPPIHEQKVIARFAIKNAAQFDALSAEANRAITLLQERRTALISAAVTGKIDVRGITLEGARP